MVVTHEKTIILSKVSRYLSNTIRFNLSLGLCRLNGPSFSCLRTLWKCSFQFDSAKIFYVSQLYFKFYKRRSGQLTDILPISYRLGISFLVHIGQELLRFRYIRGYSTLGCGEKPQSKCIIVQSTILALPVSLRAYS